VIFTQRYNGVGCRRCDIQLPELIAKKDYTVSIESDRDLEGLKLAGRVTRLVLEAMKAAVRPGA
jgi:hypothetical protein